MNEYSCLYIHINRFNICTYTIVKVSVVLNISSESNIKWTKGGGKLHNGKVWCDVNII